MLICLSFKLNQFDTFMSSVFTICSRKTGEGAETLKHASSANNDVSIVVARGRSFIKIINKIGPSTDPWGTPHLMTSFVTASYIFKLLICNNKELQTKTIR